jgi:glycosyltransferase involved in cell wall biosynthesis
VGVRFGQDTAQYLAQRIRSSGPPSLFFSYTTGALEALELLADRGTPTIVDQIDPARTEDEIVRRETRLWPGWSTRADCIPDDYYERLAAEWRCATFVVVNSEWSRSGLIEQGVPADKLRILPLAYDAPVAARPRDMASTEKTVLWVGQVVLRKGIQYLIGAARKLQKERLRFLVAGPLGISAEALRSAPSNMSFIGPVPRSDVSSLYRSADLFVFPTLSDGFGVTQLEAMAHGVPVIATRSCGDVVEHAVNGLIIPERDPEALAGAISELAFDARRLASMSAVAIETANRFSVQMLSERLRVILQEEPNQSSKR